MASTLHADFSRVRVHADGTEGPNAASRLGVAGPALGEEIAFAPGRLREDTDDGARLLVHEFVHVLQHRRGGAAPQRGRDSAAEREAASIAAQVARGGPAADVVHGTAVGIACDEGAATISAAHAGGAMGELDAAFIWGQRGFRIVLGPGGPGGHSLTASGLDILAYNPASDELWTVDNTASGGTGRVASASAITTNLRTDVATALREVRALPDFPEKAKVLAHLEATSSALARKRKVPAKVRIVVTSAGGYHSGISAKLAKRGVSFEDFTGAAARDAAKRDIAAAKAAVGTPGRSTRRPATVATTPAAAAPATPTPSAVAAPAALLELRGRRTDVGSLLVAAIGLAASVDPRINYATALLQSSVALGASGMLGGTAIAAELVVAREDLYRIRGNANDAVASLNRLIEMLDEDIATLEYYSQ